MNSVPGMLFSIMVVFHTPAFGAFELYVSPNGNDMWPGRLPEPNQEKTDGPVATLTKARDLVRLIPKKERTSEIIVYVRGGVYRLPETLIFTGLDAGTIDSPVVYRPYGKEKVTLTGSREIKNCAIHKENILRCEVSDLNLGRLSAVNPQQTPAVPHFDLYWDEQRLDLARWPNRNTNDVHGTWAHIQGVVNSNTVFNYPAAMRPEKWTKSDQVQLHIFPYVDWRDEFIDIKSVNIENKTITLNKSAIYGLRPGQRFYVRNAYTELDAPGEWYFSNDDERLYIYPHGAGQAQTTYLDTLIRIEGADYITIRGFTLEFSRDAAIEIASGEHNNILGNVMRHTGQFGIRAAGKNNRVAGNDVYDTGLGGIKVTGGDRATLTAGNNVVDNNHISRYGQIIEMNHSPGIWVEGVGQQITHNLIHEGPHFGIWLAGNDHIIEYNEIYHVNRNCQDCGAIHSYGDMTYRGAIIRYNNIHDIAGWGLKSFQNGISTYQSPYWFGAAIYLDAPTSGFVVTGNIIYRVPSPQIFVNGGRDNVITGNMIIDSGDNNTHAPIYINQWKRIGEMLSSLTKMPYQSPSWSSRYPDLAKPMRNPLWPEGNKVIKNIVAVSKPYPNGFVAYHYNVPADAVHIDGNVTWNGGFPVLVKRQYLNGDRSKDTISWGQWVESGFDAQGMSIDPMFADAAQDDYQLKLQSPALQTGFSRIPIDRIGLYQSPERAAWPAPVDDRKEDLKPKTFTYDF